MGSFMGNATGTNNGFSANGASSLIGPNSTNLLQNMNANQANVNQLYGQQQNLGNQFAAQAQGQGPNPAQMQLQQGTNRAIQQSTGMLASQRGISPALAQRMAAQNAAGMTQQAAGQGALMGAQQQMNAQGALSGLYGQLSNQQLGQQSTLQNALSAWNNNQVGMQSNMNDANASAAAQNAKNSQGLFGGAVSGGGSAIMQGLAKGGEVKRYADGGPVLSSWGFNAQPSIRQGAQSHAGQYLNDENGQQSKGGSSGGGGQGLGQLMNSFGGSGGMSDDAAQEGYLDADSMLGVAGVDNPEVMLPATGAGADVGTAAGLGAADLGAGAGAAGLAGGAAAGGAAAGGAATIAELAPLAALAASRGLMVPGKAKIKGDSLKNDKVPAMLSPKEIVLPRSVTLSPDAPKKAAAFVAAVQSRSRNKMPAKRSA